MFRFSFTGHRMDDLDGKEILLGTYEAFILGYKLSEDKNSLVNVLTAYLVKNDWL